MKDLHCLNLGIIHLNIKWVRIEKKKRESQWLSLLHLNRAIEGSSGIKAKYQVQSTSRSSATEYIQRFMTNPQRDQQLPLYVTLCIARVRYDTIRSGRFQIVPIVRPFQPKRMRQTISSCVLPLWLSVSDSVFNKQATYLCRDLSILIFALITSLYASLSLWNHVSDHIFSDPIRSSLITVVGEHRGQLVAVKRPTNPVRRL